MYETCLRSKFYVRGSWVKRSEYYIDFERILIDTEWASKMYETVDLDYENEIKSK